MTDINSEYRRKWWILSVAAAGVLLSTIDSSIVNIALPTIGEQFQSSVRATAWVTISYLLVITGLLLIFGRLSDICGQKLVFTGGLAVFTIGSAMCAAAQNVTQLAIFRSVQGIGAAMIVSNTPAIVTNAFPASQRGRGLGVIGAVVSVGLMLGPPLGGIIIHYLGWPFIFLVNLPIGVAAILLTLRVLPERKADVGGAPFNPLDSLLWVLGVTVLIVAFRASGRFSTVAGDFAIYFAAGMMLLSTFYLRQIRSAAPLLKPGFFRNQIFLFASIAGLFAYMSMISLTFMLPFVLEYTFGLSPLDSGKILMVVPATTAFVSPTSGHLSDKYGQRPIAGLGTIIFTGAIISMFYFSPTTPIWRVILSLVIFGLGFGMFGSPNNSALMGSVDIKDRGSAGGIMATVRNLGFVLGLGMISLIFNPGLLGRDPAGAQAYIAAFKGALPIIIGLSLMALIFSALRKSVS